MYVNHKHGVLQAAFLLSGSNGEVRAAICWALINLAKWK